MIMAVLVMARDGHACAGMRTGPVRMRAHNACARMPISTDDNQSSSEITSLSNGGYVITWHSRGQDGSEYGIHAQQFDSSGKKKNTEFHVNTCTDNSQIYPSIGSLSNGGYVIAWDSFGRDGSESGVYAQDYDSNSVKVHKYTNYPRATDVSQTISQMSILNFADYAFDTDEGAKMKFTS